MNLYQEPPLFPPYVNLALRVSFHLLPCARVAALQTALGSAYGRGEKMCTSTRFQQSTSCWELATGF